MPAMRTVTLIASPTVSQALNHRTISTAPESPPMAADPGPPTKMPKHADTGGHEREADQDAQGNRNRPDVAEQPRVGRVEGRILARG